MSSNCRSGRWPAMPFMPRSRAAGCATGCLLGARLRRRAVGEIFRRHAGRALCAVPAVRPRRAPALATPGPWLALAVALVVAAPHLVWLLQTRFPAVRLCRAARRRCSGWFDHLLHPAVFAGGQFFFALPSLFIAAALFWPRPKPAAARRSATADAFDRRIVTLLAFGPALRHGGSTA